MEARQAMLMGLERQPGLVSFIHPGPGPVAFSPDGKLLAAGGWVVSLDSVYERATG
jgi:hypothetical protein